MADIDRIRAAQIRSLYRQTPVGLFSAACVAVLIATVGHSAETPQIRAVGWGLSIVGLAVVHFALIVAYRRASPVDAAWRLWMALFTAMALIEGIAWGCGALLLSSADDVTQALVLIVAWAGLGSAGAIVFGAYLPTYLIFLFPMMSPHVFLALYHRYPHFELLAGLETMFLMAMPLIALQYSRQLIASLRLGFANLDLASDLSRQKLVAEQANLAKSQFLAAASHDLRQPVHALGLFVGALSGRKMDAVSRRLLEQIVKSVAALDELFVGLLDISKLDAGAVQVHREPVAMSAMLDRLIRDHADEAAAKQITLRQHPCSMLVDSDPVMLDRILRNILSNAVRYTDKGGVLIGCRRRGADVSIEIWDTGRGIPEAEHDRIFQEFYQIDNPERDRSKGVGLGLAIVRRSADLLGVETTFRSVPGSGSVFRVAVPKATSAAVVADPIVPAVTSSLICVVDDDAAIRDAMYSLLTGWGHTVAVAGSASEIVMRYPQPGQCPDLIICDYRLSGQETGLTSIAALRQHFSTTIPAIILTGDTAPDRIAEAHASGFVLLHKPLSSGKLRAAVGNMLRKTAV
ncbi:MAG: hybrid sensor histidine kinase/response regulator [Hyphomicrobiales bacterium]|nr:hybrid sensor histidine kinase/response regulator [Hyphomicrobiales bacterium]